MRIRPAGITIQRDIQRALGVCDGCRLRLGMSATHLQCHQRILGSRECSRDGRRILHDPVAVTGFREIHAGRDWTTGITAVPNAAPIAHNELGREGRLPMAVLPGPALAAAFFLASPFTAPLRGCASPRLIFHFLVRFRPRGRAAGLVAG
jgi:hypothetical protein